MARLDFSYFVSAFRATAVLLATLGVAQFAACRYTPPPGISSSVPEAGKSMGRDDAINVTFTTPVKPATLSVTLSTRQLDAENELLPPCSDTVAESCSMRIAGPCSPTGDCPGATLTLSDDRTTITLDPDDDMAVGQYIMRIASGLADDDGRDTGVPLDLFFYVSLAGAAAPTTFASGVMLTWMDLDEPMSFPLEVYWIFTVDPETGFITGSGCDGDPRDMKNVDRSAHLQAQWRPTTTGVDGFHFVFSGQVLDVTDAKYYFETEPFYIYAQPPFEVEVMDGNVKLEGVTNTSLNRVEFNGVMYSPRTYIFGNHTTDIPPAVARGTVFGYRLTEAEIAEIQELYPDDWAACASTIPDTDHP